MLFKTERTFVRAFEQKDFEDLKKLLSDPVVMKTTGFKTPQPIEKIHELHSKWMSEATNSLSTWGAFDLQTNEFLAWFMLRPIDDSDPELGYVLPQKSWGKGYATEISKAFLDYAFEQLKKERVIATSYANNFASIHILEKIGMTNYSKDNPLSNAVYFEIFAMSKGQK